MLEPAEIVASLLRQHAPVSFAAHGPSMHPTIRDGDIVTARPLPGTRFRKGSVIAYQMRGRIVVHRCIINEKRTNRVFTAGDAGLAGGDWIPAADVLGVAESARRGEKSRRLDTRRARWAGLLRFYGRPVRRIAVAVFRRFQ